MKRINTEMVDKAERIAVLMVRYMLEIIPAEEHDELDEWVGDSDLNMQLFEEMTNPEKIENKLRKFVNS
jgi:hypothetical protein